VNIQDDMLGGEVDTHSLPTFFAPNSTFTWHIDRSQSIVYTFRTSSDVVGSASTLTGSSSTSSGSSSGATSDDIVGSGLTASRGTLAGTVTPAGRVTIAYRGKSISSLKAGRALRRTSVLGSTRGEAQDVDRHRERVRGQALGHAQPDARPLVIWPDRRDKRPHGFRQLIRR
jgi:hypothetical protein